MTEAVYPATFDPVTNGHVDIAKRAALLFDHLYVGVYDRPQKSLLFSAEERFEMTQKAVDDLENVTVKRYNGLTVDFARDCGAQVIVRGLRVLSDFEWEFQLALTNRQLAPDIDTICLMASQEYSFLSASVAKEVAMLDGDVSELVPPHVHEALHEKLKGSEGGGHDKVRIVSLRDN